MVAEYRRRVADWLESRGATNIVWGNGGKRCRLSFRLNGVDRAFPIARTPGDGDIHKVIIGQLNRDLGRPPERRHLRPLESDRPTICPETQDHCKKFDYCTGERCYLVAAREGLKPVPPTTAPFSERIISMGLAERQGDLLVNTDYSKVEERVMATETKAHQGHIAMYVSTDGAKRRLRFRWPLDVSHQLSSRMLQLEQLGDWHWAIRPGGRPATELRPGNLEDTDMIEFMVPSDCCEPSEFGVTPCEFMVVDGTVMATVDPAKLATVRHTSPYTKGGRSKPSLSEDEVRQRVNEIKRLTKEVYEGSSIRMEVDDEDGEPTVLTLDCIRWVRPREEW